MEKKKRESSEDFIGWKSDDGLLEVVGIVEKCKHTKFKVICHKCKEDKELFPDGYFVSDKVSLKRGCKPCGCAKAPKWSKEQYEVRISRVLEGTDVKFLGFIPDDSVSVGRKTKIRLFCRIHNLHWITTLGTFLTGSKCKQCHFEKLKLTKRKDEQTLVDELNKKCEEHDYKFLGFVGEYRSAHSYIRYECSVHGEQTISISNFLYGGNKCPDCSSTGFDKKRPASLYVTLWSNNIDSFIKFGITNNLPEDRMVAQQRFTSFVPKLIFHKRWEVGEVAFNIESFLKNNIERGVIPKHIFPDGYTETINYNSLNRLLDFISTAEDMFSQLNFTLPKTS